MANTNKNFFDSMLETQNKMMDTLVSNSKKMTSNNPILADVLEKGTEAYNKAINETKKTFENVTEKTTTTQNEMKNSVEGMNSYFKNWYEQQVETSKKMFDVNAGSMNNMYNQAKNPQSWMDSMTTNWKNANAMNDFQNMMNPNNIQENMKKAGEQMTASYTTMQENMQKMYADGMKNMNNDTTSDAFKGMFNMAGGFAKFHEMMTPILTNMKNSTFNMDSFNQSFDMNQFKSFMDQYFSFMPKGNEDYMKQMNDLMKSSMSNSNGDMMNMMNNMKASMNNMMPGMTGNPYAAMLDNYTKMQAQMTTAVSPFSTLFQSNDKVKNMEEMMDIMNRTNIYNIKNAQMQQMVYETGSKVMEQLTTNLMNKAEHGEEVESVLALYQEFLNMSDAAFVTLFETDEYSQLMAEVSSMQLRLKKDMQLQTEKMFENLPLATRSEMDELYKTIYEMKKEMRGQKNTTNTEAKATKPAVEKTATTVKKEVAKKVVPVAKTAIPVVKKTAKKK
jgi:hypothetical protein